MRDNERKFLNTLDDVATWPSYKIKRDVPASPDLQVHDERGQWLRAAQLISLNIAEDNGKRNHKVRAHFLALLHSSWVSVLMCCHPGCGGDHKGYQGSECRFDQHFIRSANHNSSKITVSLNGTR